MTPLIITFRDGGYVRVFIELVDPFLTQVKASCSSVYNIEEAVEVVNEDTLRECAITLSDGTRMTCCMPESEIESVETKSKHIMFCEEVFTTELLSLGTQEALLDQRLNGVYSVINNIPDKKRRIKLHREYIKRKSAYIAAMEALIDGAFRD